MRGVLFFDLVKGARRRRGGDPALSRDDPALDGAPADVHGGASVRAQTREGPARLDRGGDADGCRPADTGPNGPEIGRGDLRVSFLIQYNALHAVFRRIRACPENAKRARPGQAMPSAVLYMSRTASSSATSLGSRARSAITLRRTFVS